MSMELRRKPELEQQRGFKAIGKRNELMAGPWHMTQTQRYSKIFRDFEVGRGKRVCKRDSERAASAVGGKPAACDVLEAKTKCD